jgi:hypothetical protein
MSKTGQRTKDYRKENEMRKKAIEAENEFLKEYSVQHRASDRRCGLNQSMLILGPDGTILNGLISSWLK